MSKRKYYVVWVWYRNMFRSKQWFQSYYDAQLYARSLGQKRWYKTKIKTVWRNV